MIPDVSVVIPTYNRAGTVERAIASVVEPDLEIEIIVVDDASTDGTAARLSTRPNIRYQRLERNGGPAAARNAGVAAARAGHIAFLDSDDVRVAGSLRHQLKRLGEHPDSALVYGRYRYFGAVEQIGFSGGAASTPLHVGDIYSELFRFNPISPVTAVLRTQVLRDCGGFDASFRRSEEWDLWLRVCARSPVCAVDEVVAFVEAASDGSHASGDPVLIETTSAEVVRRHLAGPHCRPLSSAEKRRIYREFCRLRVDMMLWKTLVRGRSADAALRLRCLGACLALSPAQMLRPANLKNCLRLLTDYGGHS